ncbi:phosphoinositide 3-kinase adapter protein 1-like isoform X2 [Physella acuta]|uniref:phosphoinositide 3-kinase adapter protein 1-like isoform X2 n=1 Tax=Physella acuta TaxID=109671 RepID=UPI0027DAF424|nr:phosphoinositide 3-kinase adapter protein 1-like isoform X2 [Physella acuta]
MTPSHTPKPALPPPPNFKPAVKPFGPRPSPPPGNSEPPKITPRKPSDQTLEDTQDSEYVVPDSPLKKAIPSPKQFLQTSIKPVIPAGAIGSRSQSELIEIQQEVKNGNFSIEEAEMLFRSWKERYETGNAVSFKERQQTLQALREKHVKAMDALKNVKSKNKTKLKKCIEHPEEDDILSPEISEPFSLRSTTIKEVHRGSNASSTSSLMRISKDSGRESADIRGSITSTSSDESELYDDGSRLQQTIEQRTHTFPRPSQSFFRGPRMHRRHSSDTPSHAVNRPNDEIYSTVRQIAYYSHSTKQTRKKDSQ